MRPAIQAGNVAVVTGAAFGGIGYAMASKLLHQGLKVVLADNSKPMLDRAGTALQSSGIKQDDFILVDTDVSSKDSCDQLAEAAFSTFGTVDLLHLNAGVSGAGSGKAWDRSGVFEKVFGVNAGGVFNGAQAFVGRMVESRAKDKAGLVLVTGSKQGITMPPGTGAAYNVSKATVKAYTEMLDYELRNLPDRNMRAALLVPGWVYTKLTSGGKSTDEGAQKPEGAWTPEQTVDYVLEQLEHDKFYIICPDNETSEATDKKRIQWSMGDVSEGRPPLSRWHPDHKQAFESHMAS